MASSDRVSVAPSIVLVVIVPVSEPDISTTPPPEEPSCAAAEPPRASTSTVFSAKVNTSFTEPMTTVGKSANCICLDPRNCAPYVAITTGVSGRDGFVASGRKGNEDGSSTEVALLVIARKAKSYSPVPFGDVRVSTFAFAVTHAGEI